MKKVKLIENQVIFSENQRFRQFWLWTIIAISVLTSYYALFYQTNPQMTDALVLFLFLLIGLSLTLSFYFTELRTRITEEGIYVKFFPFHLKWQYFQWNEIKEFEKKKYRPILEYGGWGIRNGIHGKAYNVSGNMGIQLMFIDGKRLLIGTQKPDDFERTINELKRG